MNEEALDDDEGDEDDSPPLQVFFDIEAIQPHEQHVPNLVVAETEEDDLPVRFPGPHCIRDFLEWLDTLTQNDTRRVNILAHNFQGYDGYFVVHQYHSDNRIVQQLSSARFIEFLPDAAVRISQNLWINGTEKRVLPTQV